MALRYSIVHGSRQSFKNAYSGALRIFSLRLISGRQPVLYEDGKQMRDFVSVHDVAAANVLVLENEKANFQVFNVGSGRKYTVGKLAEIIAEVLGVKLKAEIPGTFRVGDIRHAVFDISKLRNLGWRPRIEEKDSVKEYINWLKTQKIDKDYVTISENLLVETGTLRKVVGS